MQAKTEVSSMYNNQAVRPPQYVPLCHCRPFRSENTVNFRSRR